MASRPVTPSKPCEKLPGSKRIFEPFNSTSTQEWPKCVSRMISSMPFTGGGRHPISHSMRRFQTAPGKLVDTRCFTLGSRTSTEEQHVARVVVEVMPKAEIL